MGRPAEFFKKGFLKILLIINTKPQKNAVLYLNIRQAIHKILQKKQRQSFDCLYCGLRLIYQIGIKYRQ